MIKVQESAMLDHEMTRKLMLAMIQAADKDASVTRQ